MPLPPDPRDFTYYCDSFRFLLSIFSGRAQFNFIISIKNLCVLLLNFFKNLRNALLYCQLAIGVGAFFRCSITLQRIRDISLILNLTEDNLQ